jgi:Peptidase family M28
LDAEGRKHLIDELCSFERRGPGTDAERRAANMLAGRLRGMRRRVEIEPFFCHPQYALVHALHAVVAIAGSLVATSIPALGFGLVLVAAVSAYLDLNTRLYLARSLFFRRSSQNVVSPGPSPDAPARLILVAHYDAARTGYVFGERSMRLARRLSERGRLLLGPFRIFFWAGIAPLLPILGARLAGFDPGWLAIVQLIPTVLLVTSVFLFVDIALSEIVPGAYDNASGVAAVLSGAEELGTEPPAALDVWVVLAGSEESLCEGMRSFVRSNRGQLDTERTFVVNVDSVSHGELTYEVSEGPVISQPLNPRLIELCEALGAADAPGERRLAARPLRYPLLDDALPAQTRGIPAITIRTTVDGLLAPWYHTPDDTPQRVDGEALARATDFVVALARLLDRDLSRNAGISPPSPQPAPHPVV